MTVGKGTNDTDELLDNLCFKTIIRKNYKGLNNHPC